jgi:hypothetical protein
MVSRILKISSIVLISINILHAQTNEIKPDINKNILDSINEYTQRKYYLPISKKKVDVSLTGIIIPDSREVFKPYTVLHIDF